jgi:pimeloyl-ACP methyl ester carboxylesterase
MDEQAERPTGWVIGSDGTRIAYWAAGDGPVVVLVHGTTSDHHTMNELVPHLARTRTVITFDRRGRGLSGDGPSYDIALEFGDVQAVVEQAAARQGAPADVIGHSFGAFVALGAVARTAQARALVAYSPGFGAEYPPGSLERIDEATNSNDLDKALQLIFRDVIGMPGPDIQALRDSSVWNVRIASAHTVPRECRADRGFLAAHAKILASLRIPVLIVSGETNTGPKRQIAMELADLLPSSAVYEMPGQGHAAHHLAPEELARICLRFFADSAAVLANVPASLAAGG